MRDVDAGTSLLLLVFQKYVQRLGWAVCVFPTVTVQLPEQCTHVEHHTHVQQGGETHADATAKETAAGKGTEGEKATATTGGETARGQVKSGGGAVSDGNTHAQDLMGIGEATVVFLQGLLTWLQVCTYLYVSVHIIPLSFLSYPLSTSLSPLLSYPPRTLCSPRVSLFPPSYRPMHSQHSQTSSLQVKLALHMAASWFPAMC